MKFLKENWSSCLTVVFLIVVGVLLLVDPATYSVVILKVAGILLAALGVYDILKYFRAKPEEAAKGSGFYSGAIMITAGLFCVFGGKWYQDVFPVLAVLFGVFQILIGYRKLQQMVDALRMKKALWWMKAISAGISLLFGFIITASPYMKLMSIWVFTGLTMIIEGVFDAVGMFMQNRSKKEPEKKQEETKEETKEEEKAPEQP